MVAPYAGAWIETFHYVCHISSGSTWSHPTRVRGLKRVQFAVLAVSLLRRKGFNVVTAMNGKEAIEIYKSNKFDLIFMDINLPILDGYAAAAIIRENESNGIHHTPIIAMTAYALKGDKEKCLESGMDDYITKPISFDEVYEKIDKWLSKT